jgi:hypothetical protein
MLVPLVFNIRKKIYLVGGEEKSEKVKLWEKKLIMKEKRK